MDGRESLEEKLSRLSKKKGVKASIVLDRSTGAILNGQDQLSALNSAAVLTGQSTVNPFPREQGQTQEAEGEGLEELAGKIWNWVNQSGALVEELDSEDELKLLRLRTKKHELVIVPDPKYLLIVVHDTPPV